MSRGFPGLTKFPPGFCQYTDYAQFVGYLEQGYSSSQWSYQLFDSYFRSSWLAEKIVTVVPDDMTDKWRKFVHEDPKLLEKRQEFEEEFDIAATICEVLTNARLYGGGALIPIIDGLYNDKEFIRKFDINKVKKGSLYGFQAMNKYDFAPVSGINRDIFESPELFGDYLRYTIIRIQSAISGDNVPAIPGMTEENYAGMPQIHTSNMIKFFGKELPYYQKFFSGGWGDSVLVTIMNKIPAMEESFYLLYRYLEIFNIDDYKVKNLSAIIQSSGGQELMNKLKHFSEMMRQTKTRIIDADDKLERNQLSSIGSITEIMASLIQFCTGQSGIPLTRILGTSVGGFSTGDNELTQYYDMISMQQRKIRKQLKRIDDIIEMHLFGEIKNIKYEWVPKKELSQQEVALTKKTMADTYTAYVNARVMTPQ